MTVNETIASALALMGDGRCNTLGYKDETVFNLALSAVNHIATDLGYIGPITEPEQQLQLPLPAIRAMPYGIAMLLALAEGDADRNAVFGTIYNGLRATAKGSIGAVRDTLPKSGVAL